MEQGQTTVYEALGEKEPAPTEKESMTEKDTELKPHRAIQNMPDMDQSRRDALKQNILERGQHVPIVVDGDTGEIVDGLHRYRVMRELGLQPRTERRHFESDEDREAFAYESNLFRRDLGPKAWGDAWIRYKQVRGVKEGAGRPKEGEENSASPAELANELGVSERVAYERQQLSNSLAEHPILGQRVDSNSLGQVVAKTMADNYPHLATLAEETNAEGKYIVSKDRASKLVNKHSDLGEKVNNGEMSVGEAGVEIDARAERERKEKERQKKEQEAQESGSVTVEDVMTGEGPMPEIPNKEMSDSEKQGYKLFEKYHELTGYDPEEVAKAHHPEKDRDRYEVQVKRAGEIIGWFERYYDALLAMNEEGD